MSHKRNNHFFPHTLQDITHRMTNCLRKITVGGALAPTTPNPKRKPAAANEQERNELPGNLRKTFGGPIEANGKQEQISNGRG